MRQDLNGHVWIVVEYGGKLYEYNRTLMDSWEQQAKEAGIKWLRD